ncbi:BON domain-containing protein [Thiohalorhabdus sp.]|uniref:BON domain-containing protein n=1 Tax=Thiohalorhabdus sp. TaxID=3094134 RepID=UPI002FC3419F
MPHYIRIGALLAALLIASSGAWAQNQAPNESGSTHGGKSEEAGGVTKELKDLGREIQRAMREHGEYAGDRLGKLGEEGRTWMGDRALQARVKTTIMGVLGVASVGQINVDVDGGVVTLTGELDSWERVARAVQATNQVEGVRRVVSRLNVPDAA